MRVVGYQATLCFHCAMTALNLEAPRVMASTWTCRWSCSEGCGMARCTTTWDGFTLGEGRAVG